MDPTEFRLVPLVDCMLRGVVNRTRETVNAVVGEGTETVDLKPENIPPHEHHSSMLTDTGISTIEAVTGTTSQTKPISSQIRVDVFNHDSAVAGVSDNEMDGVWGTFSLSDSYGETTTHNNMPEYHRYLAFAVVKNV